MRQELSDQTIRLRRPGPDDADRMFEAVRESITNADLLPWMPWCHEGYSRDEAREWVAAREAAWNAEQEFDFIIEDAETGQYLGMCGFNRIDKHRRCANLGYWVRSSRTGRGVAPAAVRLLVRFGFEDLDLERIELTVAVENTRSLAVARKTGAVREGVLRSLLPLKDRRHDAVLFSFVRGDIVT